MSLQFILGGSGTGKSELLFHRIIEDAAQHPERMHLLIVPGQYNMQALMHMVELHPDHAFMNIDILSFERLAYRVFDEVGREPETLLDDTEKTMLIRRLLLTLREDLKAYGGSIRKKGFAGQMQSMLSELLQYGTTPEALQEKAGEVAANAGLYARLIDIHRVYSAFMDYIRERYMTTEELLERLSRVIDRSEKIRSAWVYFDAFTGFTPVQYELVRHILALSPRTVMTFTTDAGVAAGQRPDKEDLFYITKNTVRDLTEMCETYHIHREEDIFLSDDRGRFGDREDLRALSAGLFRPEITPFEGACPHVEVRAMTDPAAEMRYTALRIHQLVREEGLRYSDIAVVTSDMDRFRAGAGYWFDQYDIPCFFDYRRPIGSNMLSEWLRALLGMFLTDFSYASVFRYMKSGLSSFGEDETDLTENFVLAAGIRGFRKWQSAWILTSDWMSDEEMEKVNQVRDRFAGLLGPLYEKLNHSQLPVRDICDGLLAQMEEESMEKRVDEAREAFEKAGDLERAGEYSQIYDVVTNLLEKMGRILGDQTMTLKEFNDVLMTGLSELRMGVIPPGFDQVVFGDLRRTRLGQIKVLFFVGLNDGIVPLPQVTNGLITEEERELLKAHKLSLAPTARENFSTERFYVYSALSRASHRVIMTYACQDPDGTQVQPSSLIRRIQAILPSLTVERGMKGTRSDHLDVHQAYYLLIKGLRRKAAGEAPDRIWEMIHHWFASDPAYADKVKRLEKAAFFAYQPGLLPRDVVRGLYHDEMAGSVSMLEQYAACAYAHFLTYGLRLKERKIFKVMAPDIGNILHAALEIFAKKAAATTCGWRDLPDEERDSMAEACLRNVAESYGNAILTDSARGQYMADRLSVLMKRTVWAMQKQLQQGDFEPVGYEVRFEAGLEAEGLEVVCGDQGRLFLKGRIDRTDRLEEEDQICLKVIDYKSGSVRFDPSEVYYGLQLQLIVYMTAACAREKEKRKDKLIVPAGIFYYHLDDPVLEAADMDELAGMDEDEESRLLDALCPDGLVVGSPEDESMIRRMDHHPEQKPKVIPVSYGKTGKMQEGYSSVITSEDFALLTAFARQRIEDLGEGIFSGDIRIDPYILGNKNACSYCAFRSVCGFDTGIPGYTYRRLKKLDKKKGLEWLHEEA